MADLELLTVGDATLDCFLNPSESETLCSLDDKKCHICFSYGDKIPVRYIDFSLGGNAANNAVGTKRLGIKSALVLTLGDDLTGKQIVSKLEEEGVDMSYIIQQKSTTSNYSSVISYMGERTIFVYHAPRSYEFPVNLPVTPWMYLTSMGEAYMPFYNHVIDWLKKNPNVKVAYNPGTWQLRGGLEANIEILKRCYVIYVNRQEAQRLTSFDDSTGKEKELLTALSALGPKICIITDGERGVFAYDGVSYYKLGVLPVDAYERTGAGDAFGSACIAALIREKPLSEALVWGTVNSASVIGYTGAQKGLLRESDLPEWLTRAISCNLKVETF